MKGIIIINKPSGFTSFDVVAVARGLLKTKKIGHAGTLDPMATGVLPLFIGEAARAVDLLPCQDKSYRAAFQLGVSTDTLDSTGVVLRTSPLPVTARQVEEALQALRGGTQQVPPMYSALRRDGKRLYELARAGVEVERAPRPVTVYKLELLRYDAAARSGELDISCSKGTYVRSLIDDMGRALGCGGMMTGLVRTMAAGFTLEQSITLEQARALAAEGGLEARLLPVDQVFSDLPSVTLSPRQSVRYRNGGELDLERLRGAQPGCRYRVYSDTKEFLGLGQTGQTQLKVLKNF